MRILFVTAGFPSPIGQIHIYNLVRALRDAHTVSIVCFDLGSNEERVWEEALDVSGEIVRIPLARKGLVRRGLHSLLSLDPVAVEAYRSQQMSERLPEVCRRGQFDVVVVEQLALGQYAGVLGDVPKMLFPVDAVSRLKRQRYRVAWNPLVKAGYFVDYLMTKRYERMVYAKYDAIMFVSGADAQYTITQQAIDPGGIHVLANGVDTSYFRPEPWSRAGETALVFMGNMANYINEHAVVWFHRHVWEGLKSRVRDVKLYVVGNAPGTRVRKLAERDRDIVVTGYLKDFRPYVWSAKIVVSPLQVGTGIKNRILQAMAMGKAIVASPLSVEGIDIKDGDHVVVASTPEQFVEQLVWLLADDRGRDRLGTRAREYVEENHALATVGEKYVRILQSVIAQRARSYAAG